MRKLYFILIMLLGLHCREKYEVLLPPSQTNVLVIEGIVNSGGSTNIRLTRATSLGELTIVPETGASVFVDGDDHSTFQLTPVDSGNYAAPQVPINPNVKYRLRIVTADNKEYQSDYRSVLQTQPIDSVSYLPEGDGVRFYINSHGAGAQQYYYKWDLEETWEIHSSYRSNLKFTVVGSGDSPAVYIDYFDPVNHSVNEAIYTCWQSRVSREINIGTTEHLSESHIFLPVRFIKRDAIEFSVLYSALVKQYALSPEGYEFYRKMKKNSESLGSIFDAQPSEIVGNITCVNDPRQLVIGFAEFTSLQQKRIFVHSGDIPGPKYDPGCAAFSGMGSKYKYPFEVRPEVLLYVYKELDFLPTRMLHLSMGPEPSTFDAQSKFCVDCTLRGSNVKPPFWP
jgi:hypothetical protein